MKVIRTRSRFI